MYFYVNIYFLELSLIVLFGVYVLTKLLKFMATFLSLDFFGWNEGFSRTAPIQMKPRGVSWAGNWGLSPARSSFGFRTSVLKQRCSSFFFIKFKGRFGFLIWTLNGEWPFLVCFRLNMSAQITLPFGPRMKGSNVKTLQSERHWRMWSAHRVGVHPSVKKNGSVT